ncbi:TPA: hypothetical protein HA241_07505 [Candidatus Woesearchaeota archaeon]|nr:hypothetical protein [Candidatus Woesearchaeota archaeon]
MTDKYENLREAYDGLIKNIVPELTAQTVDEAVQAVNTLVRLQRPVNWAVSNEPRVILGVTSDGEKAVYGEVGRLGFYIAVPFNDLRERISTLVEEGRIDCKSLDDLVDLKPK